MGLIDLDDITTPRRDAGGDNTVERDSKGRPRISVSCDKCEGTGKVASPRTGNQIKCAKCKGEGRVTRSYTRTTSYIDVIEDKSNLEAWLMRMVLVGVAKDMDLLTNVEGLYADQVAAEKVLKALPLGASDEERREAKANVKKPKDALNRKAQVAKITAGAEEKADKGTFKHGLSELVDLGEPLPKGISFGDVIDMDAYRRATTIFHIVHMEHLVVNDEYKIGGTPDRVSELDVEEFKLRFPEMWEKHGGLVAPDGSVIVPGDRLITDLKTGTTEYGTLKMAMQLSVYAHSKLYDPTTGTREDIENLRQDWGVIMNVPADQGEATLYWANLTLGWEAVQVARQVRAIRSREKKALSPLLYESVA